MDIDSINKNPNIASYLVREATERPHELAVVAPYNATILQMVLNQ